MVRTAVKSDFHRRVVFVGPESSVFVSRTRDALISRGIQVTVLDPFYNFEYWKPHVSIFRKIAYFLNSFFYIFRKSIIIERDQTAVIHGINSHIIWWLAPFLRYKFRRVVAIAYGSDILRRKRTRDKALQFGLRYLDMIAATNHNVLAEIEKSFPIIKSKERGVVRFGLPVFDEIEKIPKLSAEEAKKILGYSESNNLICLGYSASSGQRQVDLIKFFCNRANQFPNYTFVIPIQYGEKAVVEAVRQEAKNANKLCGMKKFFPLADFHDPATSAIMRRATTVLLNHSLSDAFSGTVQEVIYAGNNVLAAAHLPYENMPGYGSSLLPYDSLEQAANLISESHLKKWQKYTVGSLQNTILQLRHVSSWDAVFDDWCELIDGS